MSDVFVVLLLQLSYITHDELHIPAEVKTKVADVVNCFLFLQVYLRDLKSKEELMLL